MAAVAACGGSSPTPLPTVGSSTVPSATSTGAGSAGTGSAGSGSAGTLADAPAGDTGKAQVGQQNAPSVTHGSTHSVSVGSAGISQAGGAQFSNGGSAELVSNAGSPGSGGTSTAKKKTSTKTAPTKTTTPARTSTPTKTTSSSSTTVTVPQQTGPPKTIVRTVYRTKYEVRTVVHTVVKVRTVTKKLRPSVPSTAFLPSQHPALALTSFTVSGSNVGCQIGSGGVRCSIQRRIWAAPPQPIKCRRTWGDTLSMANSGPASFACGGSSGIVANAQVIPDGWDDTVGKVTCQVRGIGVDCFSKSHHGFIISRTGYAAY